MRISFKRSSSQRFDRRNHPLDHLPSRSQRLPHPHRQGSQRSSQRYQSSRIKLAVFQLAFIASFYNFKEITLV